MFTDLAKNFLMSILLKIVERVYLRGYDGTPFPNLNNEPHPDDLYPEEYVTKPFWKDFYWCVEQRRVESKYQ